MIRLLWVATLLVTVGLLAAPAWASVPYRDSCVVTWGGPNPTHYDSCRFICPKGDGQYLDVLVRDEFGRPLGLVFVSVTFGNAQVVLKTPCEGYTLVDGTIHLLIKGSINVTGGTLDIRSSIHVLAGGVPIYENDAIILSPDNNQIPPSNGIVNAQDYAYFQDDWQRVQLDCHSNFNRDSTSPTFNKVDSQDYAVFQSHWTHQ
jgi:hypothetical protein